MKIHTRSKKNFDSCQVTPGGPWKGFSCYQIPLINLYGMELQNDLDNIVLIFWVHASSSLCNKDAPVIELQTWDIKGQG